MAAAQEPSKPLLDSAGLAILEIGVEYRTEADIFRRDYIARGGSEKDLENGPRK